MMLRRLIPYRQKYFSPENSRLRKLTKNNIYCPFLFFYPLLIKLELIMSSDHRTLLFKPLIFFFSFFFSFISVFLPYFIKCKYFYKRVNN